MNKVLPTYSISSLLHLPGDIVSNRLENYIEAHPDLHFPHKHSFYHLVYFSAGNGNHSIDFEIFPVQAGELYFMVPGQVHSWNFNISPEGFIINFSKTYLNGLIADPGYIDQFSFFSGIAKEQVISIPEKYRNEIIATLEKINKETKAEDMFKDDYVRTMLLQVFIQVNRISGNKAGLNGGYNSVLLLNFRKLIELHYKQMKLPNQYAALLYVTPNHLNALSKDLTGLSAGELIRERILLEAKRLLVNAQLSISEIAAELNFSDNSYFSRFFKKYAGTSPEEFRNIINKKLKK